ncbi:MAG: hypothetical protein IH608_08780, partial [Proteobacteria bacterium]|nr:hypothetical protein [Pseudomonadota bacterium]
DVIRVYRGAPCGGEVPADVPVATTVVNGEGCRVRTGDGRILPLTDPKVRVVVPSMGETSTRGMVAALRFVGVDAAPLPPPGCAGTRARQGNYYL